MSAPLKSCRRLAGPAVFMVACLVRMSHEWAHTAQLSFLKEAILRLAISAFIIGCTMTAPALGHHGWGSYDADKPLMLKGPIESISLQNPHGQMNLPNAGASWVVTLAPLSRMNARGATSKTLRPGVIAVAYGYPKRDGSREIRAEWIEVNGQRFQLR
jgi:hypothetical protein